MKKFLSVLMAATIALAVSSAMAETASPAPKKAVDKSEKKTAKKTTSKKSAKKVDDASTDLAEADVAGSIVTEYGCAEGHKITVFRNPDDSANVALRWGNRITRMKRIETASGAERLEHEKRGLVFIGIPAKAMLLDAKRGRQLANDCKSPEQLAQG
ncbi:MAG TPA: hypothetical protein DHV59_18865 [Oxalobacteraceae bacterium]|nr:hypothetical protein [Oxalobacteraceae bacterium]